DEQAENLRKYGGFIPGIRPGENTSKYIDYVLTRLTTVGALYLTSVALLPESPDSGHDPSERPFVQKFETFRYLMSVQISVRFLVSGWGHLLQPKVPQDRTSIFPRSNLMRIQSPIL
ncbi:MAG: preprotein translocase subunit SecY, partial [Planctomycetota bacterium]|nr:preprotein translocase subunit SecY [Planctomycetota bacterium]